MVQRREKLSRQFSVLNQSIFRKQCEMAGKENYTEEDLMWALEHGRLAVNLPASVVEAKEGVPVKKEESDKEECISKENKEELIESKEEENKVKETEVEMNIESKEIKQEDSKSEKSLDSEESRNVKRRESESKESKPNS